MRGRIAMLAIGARAGRRRGEDEAQQQLAADNAQQQEAQQQIEAQQRQIEALQQQKQQPQPQQEDPMQKLQKYADLKQKGLITEEEYQKLKAELLSKM
jgi:multidrug resistance efflux pump